jgi:hypothetical protein
MMYKLVLGVEKPASGQFRVIVFAWRNVLLALILSQSCYAIFAVVTSIPLCITCKPMILKERREGDSFRLPDNEVGKLQIQRSQRCQDCHRCHGALP